MTLLHFVNCALLTFGPPWVIYSSKLAELNVWKNVLFVSITQLVALLGKMILLATFTISSGSLESGSVDWIQEVSKTVVNAVDVFAVYLLMDSRLLSGEKEAKILTVALGWCVSDSIVTRLLPLWIGARDLEFSWRYLQMAVEANLTLVVTFAFVTAVEALKKQLSSGSGGKAQSKLLSPPGVLVVIHCLIPLLVVVLTSLLGLPMWVAYAAIALPYCLSSRRLQAPSAEALRSK
eukprot:RCo024253